MQTIVTPNVKGDQFIELTASTKKKVTGKLFRKQILFEGSFVHPANRSKRVVVDRAFSEALVENFNNGACPIVQFPSVDDSNRHVENPERNLGEVVGLSYTPGVGVFADIDVRKHIEDIGKTFIGASAMISMAHQNNITGEVKSPVLLHVAATNRPYLPNLEGFQEIMAMSDTENKEDEIVILSDLEENEGSEAIMSKDELIAALREYGVDVPDLQARAAAVDHIASLSNLIDPKDQTITLSDLAAATTELDEKNIALSEENTALTERIQVLEKERDELMLSNAAAEVDKLIEEGRLLPKARERMIALSVNDRETFDALVPDEAIVQLSDQQTVTTVEDTNTGQDEKVTAEVDRLAASYLSK